MYVHTLRMLGRYVDRDRDILSKSTIIHPLDDYRNLDCNKCSDRSKEL